MTRGRNGMRYFSSKKIIKMFEEPEEGEDIISKSEAMLKVIGKRTSLLKEPKMQKAELMGSEVGRMPEGGGDIPFYALHHTGKEVRRVSRKEREDLMRLMRNVRTTHVNTCEERIVQRVQEMGDWRERKEERTTPRWKGCNMELVFEEGRWEEKIQEESTEESEEEHDNGSEEEFRTKKKARKEATEAAMRRCNKECSQEMQSVDDKWTICRRACQRTKGHEKEKWDTGCDCTWEPSDILMHVRTNGGRHTLDCADVPNWTEVIHTA